MSSHLGNIYRALLPSPPRILKLVYHSRHLVLLLVFAFSTTGIIKTLVNKNCPHSSSWKQGYCIMSDGNHRFVVGVDYGTTYSGAAYIKVLSEDPKYNEIEVIDKWPGTGGGMDNRNLDKAPTEISFEKGESLWGYQIAPGVKRYCCFKLLLDKKTTKTRYDDPNLSSAIDSGNPNAIDSGNPNALIGLPPGKTVHDVTSEYLRFLYEYIMAQLGKRDPLNIDSTPIQFVLTTPAIWSHEAQSATLESAKKAGFASRPGDTISMVAEPEAAASYCLREVYGLKNKLEEGERVLICDAGGGTVDLVTYTVSQTFPSLRVREANVGSGGKCGSTAIDRAFLKWLESRVGPSFKTWPSKKTGRGSNLMMTFEMAKKGFGTSNHDQSWRIPLGRVDDNIEMGIEEGEIVITGENMAEIFDPVVDTIIKLIAEQIRGVNCDDIEEQPSTIILVGGFGESQYLYSKLKDWCESQSPQVKLIHPNHSWSAVARGAVIHGIESMPQIENAPGIPEIESLVDSRKLKQHYGVFLSTLFDPDVHHKETMYFDPLTMQIMSTDHVEWFAEKGRDAENGQHFPIPCFSRFPQWQSRSFTLELAGSTLDKAPVSAKRGKVNNIGQIAVDLSDLPDSAFFIVAVTPRGKIFAAEITIDMVLESANIKFQVMFEGKSYGDFKLEY